MRKYVTLVLGFACLPMLAAGIATRQARPNVGYFVAKAATKGGKGDKTEDDKTNTDVAKVAAGAAGSKVGSMIGEAAGKALGTAIATAAVEEGTLEGAEIGAVVGGPVGAVGGAIVGAL